MQIGFREDCRERADKKGPMERGQGGEGSYGGWQKIERAESKGPKERGQGGDGGWQRSAGREVVVLGETEE